MTHLAFRPVRLWMLGLVSALCPALVVAQSVKTELKETNGNWQLIREGKPYFIKGAGGSGNKPMLKEYGGNSFRTWGVDDKTQAILDEAQQLGLTVTLGYWMGHEGQGFNYDDTARVKQQFERAKAMVEKYKNHPAVLAWAVGNEMEGFGDGGKESVWKAVEEVAAMIKKADPNHPTMTVIAEIGGKRVQSINKLCPSIDIIGLNTYAGGPTIIQRYRKIGGTKPVVLTEFGGPGQWEMKKNAWGAPAELTSTAKADAYRRVYVETILAEKDKLSLGSYAFTWGFKQEATATWHGLLLPTGERLGAVDALSEEWIGKRPANLCPLIQPIKLDASDRGKPGDVIHASVSVTDPDGDPVKYEWVLRKDNAQYGGGGAHQATPKAFPEAIKDNTKSSVEITLPKYGGGYWLYAFARDNHNGAAVASLPLFVDAPKEATGQK